MNRFAQRVHLCLRLPSFLRLLYDGASSALNSAATGSVEVGEDPELAERDQVLLAAEGGGHSGEVADRCDERSEASAEWLAGGGSAEVVVAAAGAGRIRHDLDFPAAGAEFDQLLVLAIPGTSTIGWPSTRAASRSLRASASRLGLSA